MKLTTLAITIVSAAASLAVGVASYQAVAPPDPAAADSPSTAAAGSYPVARKAPPLDSVTVFADCPKGTELRGKVCIRREERTVTEYVAAPAPPPQQQVSAPTYPSNDSDPGARDEGNDDNHDSGPRDDDGPAAPPADDDHDGDHDGDEDGEDHEDGEDGEDGEDHEDEDHEDEDH